jgi:hypothetical protein
MDVHVGAADPGTLDANEDFVFPNARHRDVLQREAGCRGGLDQRFQRSLIRGGGPAGRAAGME